MKIQIPQLSLVVLIGPSGSGKSTFARKHFLPSEVLSSDVCRGWVSDDENDQTVSKEAFEVLNFIGAKRLARGKLVVVDATNVQHESRQPLISLAKQYHVQPVAIVFKVPEATCQDRNRGRSDRSFGPHVIRQQESQLRRSLKTLKREGFRHIFVLDSSQQIDLATIERVPLWTDRRDESGPFDIIGDIHGCCDELEQLLVKLGYNVTGDANDVLGGPVYSHPEGRKAVFVGDLVDRGPRILDTLRTVRNMVRTGNAICVPGNHDVKLVRKLKGRDVQITHGLAQTLAELDALPDGIRTTCCDDIAGFLDGLISHFVLDGGKLVVAHAGMKEEMQGRASGRVRDFALYGETTGETDEFGLPVRYNWAAEYRGAATVVYGHTPVPQPEWLNRTVNIDTGCVFGGKLTALRYPEQEFEAVDAKHIYCEPSRPFLTADQHAPALTSQQHNDDLLDLADVVGKRFISTKLRSNVTIREENATAALEVMSRFAANPKWLIYLPPTMSPSETCQRDGYLEHPAEAFAYFRSQGLPHVLCEEKHMGSRAVVVVCRDEETAFKRFGVTGESGIIYTRTGRRFFEDVGLEAALLERVRQAMTTTDFWRKFNSDWACLDCELMPWSAKAQELLRTQYAAVGAAGRASIPEAVSALRMAEKRMSGEERTAVQALLGKYEQRGDSIDKFVAAYRHYCWPVNSLDDLKLAPFHLLATEGHVYADKNHSWHMTTLGELCHFEPSILLATPYRVVDVTDDASQSDATSWWNEFTASGGEGMVVKPFDFIARGTKGLIQPAVKCRGPEYLRIIYGPDYTNEEHLQRLRHRGLASKRSLALREFALGMEGLERFVRHEPLRRVHECVFGVLALESEPVDPRL